MWNKPSILRSWVLASTWTGLLAGPLMAQSATDACTPTVGNEYPVSVGTACAWTTFNKPNTFTHVHEPNTCSSRNGTTSYNDAWGWFTAVNTVTTVTFDPAGNQRPILHVFTGTCGGTLTQVACHNSGGDNVNATVTFTSVIGQVYLVRIQRHQSNNTMNGTLCIRSPRSTNTCGTTAIGEYAVGSECSFTPFNKPAEYTATFNPATCNSGNFNEGWGWFTATGNTTVLTYDPDASDRAIVHVFSGACGSLTQVACVDAGSGGTNAEVLINTTPGTTYRFRVQRQGSNAVMDGQICIYSPNSNNTCSSASAHEFQVSSDCQYRAFQKPDGYTASMNPGGCNSGNFDDAWAWFTATDNFTVISYDPDGSDRAVLHVFTGNCGTLTQVGCVDANTAGNNAELMLNTTPGTVYRIRVQRQASNTAMDGRLCVSAPRTTNTCGAFTQNRFSVTSNCVFEPFLKPELYTASIAASGCNGGNFDDAWGWFTATSNRTAITYDPDQAHRPVMHIYTGSCGSLASVACSDGGATGVNAEVSIPTVVGQNYFIRIQRQGVNTAMDGTICIRTPLANDECATPTALPVLENCFMQTFSNERATRSSDTPAASCGGTANNNTQQDVWFSFVAPGSGQVIIQTQAGTINQLSMQLYQGNCGGLTAVECVSGTTPRIDRTCNPLVAGVTYRIRLWGTNGAIGNFGLCVYGPDQFTPRQEDCAGSILVCSDQQIVNSTTTNGCLQDLNSSNRGCLVSNERQGTWYTFSPSAAGTIEFTITPVDGFGNVAPVDYDFALWGPMDTKVCPPVGPPTRCSYASPTNSGSNIGAGTFLTGLRAGNTDLSEGSFNGSVNGFVAPLQVPLSDVGRTFILFIDNFSLTGQSFRLNWDLTNGCSLDCNILPVELMSFTAEALQKEVLLRWTTQTERASSHFVVERSADGAFFTPIGSMPAAGHSLQRIEYRFTDEDPYSGTSYYRLRQVDLDGTVTYSDITPVTFRGRLANLVLYPNPAQEALFAEIPQELEGEVQVVVHDASGRMMTQTVHTVEPGQQQLPIRIQGLEAGSYVVQLHHPKGSHTARFIKH